MSNTTFPFGNDLMKPEDWVGYSNTKSRDARPSSGRLLVGRSELQSHAGHAAGEPVNRPPGTLFQDTTTTDFYDPE